jgi:hypothetical protein
MKRRKPTKRKRLKAQTQRELDDLILERSDTVLWTIAPPGIVLHNFVRRQYIQLDAVGYAAWGFLDGGRTVKEVVERCSSKGQPDDRTQLQRHLRGIVQTLVENGFIEERLHV